MRYIFEDKPDATAKDLKNHNFSSNTQLGLVMDHIGMFKDLDNDNYAFFYELKAGGYSRPFKTIYEAEEEYLRLEAPKPD